MFWKKEKPADAFYDGSFADSAVAMLLDVKKRSGEVGMELIYRLQLRDDMNLLEKQIAAYRKNPSEKNKEALANAMVRLKTSSEGILNRK